MTHMKNSFVRNAAVFAAPMVCLSGCGKKTETDAGKIRRELSIARSAAGGGLRAGHSGRAAGHGRTRRSQNVQSHHGQRDRRPRRFAGSCSAGLLGFDVPTQQVKPGLAESWTNSPDGKTWTFKLRKNLRWSDGEPLTADDVVFTWNDVIYNPEINRHAGPFHR